MLALAAPALLLLAAPPSPAAAQQEEAPTEAAALTTPAVLHACYVPATGTVYRIKEPGLSQECTGPASGPRQHVEFSWTQGVPGHEHASLNGLDADDHPQYLLADGSRALTDDWSADGHTITNLGAASTAGDAVRFEQAVKVGDTGGGDLAGSYPNPTVGAIQGQPVSDVAPTTSGLVLTWDGSQWQGASVATDHGHTEFLQRSGGTMTGALSMNGNKIAGLGGGTQPGDAVRFEQAVKTGDSAEGDLGGSYPTPIVTGIRGNHVSNSPPQEGEALVFFGSQWEPQPLPSGIQGREIVSTFHDIEAGFSLRATAVCPTGKVAIGGGFSGAGSGIEVVGSGPAVFRSTWEVLFRNTTDLDDRVQAFAVCADSEF